MFFRKKKIIVPAEEKAVEAYQSWTVRWISMKYYEMIGYHVEHVEIFPSYEAANEFRDALAAAHRLLKNSEDFYTSFGIVLSANQ